MNDFRLEAQLKAGNTEQKILQVNFFLVGIAMTIIAGILVNSLYFVLRGSLFDSNIFHFFLIDLCLGFFIYAIYILKKYLNSSEFLMFHQYKYLEKYINEKYGKR